MYMGAVLAKFCLGETDINNNGVPDNRELVKLVENYMNKQKEKQNRKQLKKILK